MANNRLSMRKITEALRLHFEHNRTNREIAQAIGTSPTTVGQSTYAAPVRQAAVAQGLWINIVRQKNLTQKSNQKKKQNRAALFSCRRKVTS